MSATAITPSVYTAEGALFVTRDTVSDAVRGLGRAHVTFMCKQVLSEAPWVDVIVRGEGEEICTELMQAVANGGWPENRLKIRGLAFVGGEEIVGSPAA